MTEDYVSLYTNSPFAKENGYVAFMALMFLFMGRMLPIIALAPFFGAKVLPHPVKVTFAISLFAIFLPQLTTVTTSPLTFDLTLMIYFFKELFVGLLMGFMVSIPFIIVQNAGILIDHQRGGASLMVNDPTIQNQSSPLGTLFNLVLIYLFFRIDGPFMVIDTISQSYDVLPPDKLLNVNFFNVDTKMASDIIAIMGKVMILSTQLAAPALIMILMTDFFLGIANRLAPQVQITFLGMPLKSLLALMIVFFGWQLFVNQMVTESYTWISYLYSMVQLFRPAI
ncbi:MAG: flagellar biosynthetic protein FliR [Parachlamydiaceae bacterium]|nr:flagellar biosynthetic protein FliR [Parachlamydiaceae bacterium]